MAQVIHEKRLVSHAAIIDVWPRLCICGTTWFNCLHTPEHSIGSQRGIHDCCHNTVNNVTLLLLSGADWAQQVVVLDVDETLLLTSTTETLAQRAAIVTQQK